MEANGIQGEREYFGLLSPTAEPQPVSKLYQTLANFINSRGYLQNFYSFYLQHWLVLTKPLKKQLPGWSCTELLCNLLPLPLLISSYFLLSAGRSPYTVNLRVCMYPRDHQSITQPSTRYIQALSMYTSS